MVMAPNDANANTEILVRKATNQSVRNACSRLFVVVESGLLTSKRKIIDHLPFLRLGFVPSEPGQIGRPIET